jgi:hypothetical protein
MAEALAKVTIRLPEGLVKQAKHYAVDHDVDLQDVIAEGLRLVLARAKKGGR